MPLFGPIKKVWVAEHFGYREGELRKVDILVNGEPLDALLEEVVATAEPLLEAYDVLVVEGLVPGSGLVYAGRTNVALANALDADVLLVAGEEVVTTGSFLLKTETLKDSIGRDAAAARGGAPILVGFHYRFHPDYG